MSFQSSISQHGKSISLQRPESQSFLYNPTKWQGLGAEVRSLIKDFEKKHISRQDIFDSYREYYTKGVSAIKPFLLTMIWGFAETGYKNYRTSAYLGTEANIASITQAIDQVKRKEFHKAFKLLKKIDWMGISYLSKVLYFASKGAEINDYCLIFDIRVARALAKMMIADPVSELLDIKPSGKWKDYERYNHLIHSAAQQLKVDADQVELFLFNFSSR